MPTERVGPASVADQTMQALASNATEVLVDVHTGQAKVALARWGTDSYGN